MSTKNTSERKTATVKETKQNIVSEGAVQSESSTTASEKPREKAKLLHKDIKEAIHGDVKERLCEWQLPLENKKTDCVPAKCPPDRTTSEG